MARRKASAPVDESEVRNQEITITRHTDNGWEDFTARASATIKDGEAVDEVAYSVDDQPDISLTNDEKNSLNALLGLPPIPGSGSGESEDSDALDISQEDFDDANENEEDEDETE